VGPFSDEVSSAAEQEISEEQALQVGLEQKQMNQNAGTR
jgi:hypothetical protein